jgi:alpha-ketoglutarate-dependent taurine dioxygenase
MAMNITIRTVNEQRRFPLLVDAGEGAGREALVDWWRGNTSWIEQQLHDCGAVLFRGFRVDGHAVFEQLLRECGMPLTDYRDGNSPRTSLGGGVYTSTEYPAEFFISLHNELSYSHRWPARLWFCCVTAPTVGGETPLADSRAILQTLTADTLRAFRQSGVRYIRNLHNGNGFGPSWQQTFATSDRAEVERFLASGDVTAEWRSNGMLRLWHVRPATAVHPVTGEEVWFNQADQFHPSTHPKPIYDALMDLYENRLEDLPQNAQFGDGTNIAADMLSEIREAVRQHTVLFPWQQGDVLLVDNMLICHGRMPFSGPRRVLVAMSDS